jgi:hypothetical protein
MPSIKVSPRSAALIPVAAAENQGNNTAVPRTSSLHAQSCEGVVNTSNRNRSSSSGNGNNLNPPASGASAASPFSSPRDDPKRTFAQQLKARTPPALRHDGGGGTHSPAHQSNSTSPFYMGDGDGHRGEGGSSTHDNAKSDDADGGDHRSRPAASAFAAQQPTPINRSNGAASWSMSAPEASMYPANPNVKEAQLMAFEEQLPRGSAWDIPHVVVLRHRMGFSTVVLTARQRNAYSRHDLENFVLYKEQKYNAVNVLWRFCMLLLLVLTFSVFCLVFSTCTTEWVGLQRTDNYLSLGLFVACRDRTLRSCAARVSSRLEWTVTDVVTGATLCTASASFVHRFIGAIWAMAILQLLCEFIAVLLTAWIVARPTRSGALVVLFFDLLLATVSGIIAVVLFHHYSSCVRRTCEGEHLSGRMCHVSWRYGYKLYLGALAVHGLLLLLALCMHSYIHNIRVTARKQLRQERRRLSHRHEEAEEYMAHVLDNDDQGNNEGGKDRQRGVDWAGGGVHSEGDDAAFPQQTLTQRRGTSRNVERAKTEPPASPTHDQLEPLARSTLHVSFVGMPGVDRDGKPSAPSRGPQQLQKQQQGVGGGTADLSELPEGTAPGAATQAELPGSSSFAANQTLSGYQRQQQQRRGDRRWQDGASAAGGGGGAGVAFPTGNRHFPQHHHVPPAAAATKRAFADTPAYTQARRRKRFFDRFLQREYDANYLTAAELGVPIEGATDWIYDDRSDMYYSFERNMFWDPLTREYYNCALKTWQESPDHVVDVRDVLDYMLEESGGSCVEDDRAEQATSDAHDENNDDDNDHDSIVRHSDVEVDIDADDGHRAWLGRHHHHHGEPVTAPTTATTAGGADSSAAGGHGPSASSRHVSRSAGTVDAGDDDDVEEDEPVFRVDGDEGSADHGQLELHSMHSFVSN